MRDRLKELLNNTFEAQYEMRGLLTAEHTADHLIANGVIVPPCKVGDTVYVIAPHETIPLGDIKCKRVVGFEQYEHLFYVCCIGGKYLVRNIGKTVFLSRELAEEALNEQKKL